MGIARRPGGGMSTAEPSLGEPVAGPADEQVHRFDPDVWSWNESWYFSWIDLDGGPVGFFRLGLLPNQGRAMVWCYVHGTASGSASTRPGCATRTSTSPTASPTTSSACGSHGAPVHRRRPSPSTVWCARSPVPTRGVRPAVGVPRSDPDHRPVRHRYRHRPSGARLPGQPLRAVAPVAGTVASGTITPRGSLPVRANGHRDRSWGPRNWRMRVHARRPAGRGRAALLRRGTAVGRRVAGATCATRPVCATSRAPAARSTTTTTARTMARPTACSSPTSTARRSTSSSPPSLPASASTWRTRARNPSTGCTGGSWSKCACPGGRHRCGGGSKRVATAA